MLAIIFVDGGISFIKAVFVSETDVEICKVVIGAIGAYHNFEVLVAGLSHGIGADIGELNCGICKREIWIGDGRIGTTDCIDGNIYVGCNATLVVKGNVETNCFACINHTVAIVACADRCAIVNGVVVEIYIGFGDLSHCKICICNCVFAHCVLIDNRSLGTCVDNLRLDEFVGVYFTIGVVGAKQCCNTSNSWRSHGCTIETCIFVTWPCGWNCFTRSINFVLYRVVWIVVKVRET